MNKKLNIYIFCSENFFFNRFWSFWAFVVGSSCRHFIKEINSCDNFLTFKICENSSLKINLNKIK